MKKFLPAFLGLLAVAAILVVPELRVLAPAELAYLKLLLQFGGWVIVGILFICVVFINDDKDIPSSFLAFLGLLLIVVWRLT
jgi:hypothetical protein